MITKKTRLSISHKQLIIDKEEKVSIPLEDICSVIIEDQQVVITTSVLSAFSEYNIVLFTCNEKRLPNGILTAFHKHSRQLGVLQMQYALSKPFKKRIWQRIIISKLQNQGKCLELLNKEGFSELYSISRSVDSGDTTNREAYGAKIYFVRLFGRNFTRRNDETINVALNYGYAILRGLIARSLVNYGFFPCLGIYHDNELNSFNLVDDFIEVFRPLVDLFVAENVTNKHDFSSELRVKLYNLLNMDILLNNEKLTITNAIEEMVKSFVGACRIQDPSLIKIPELIPINLHSYE